KPHPREQLHRLGFRLLLGALEHAYRCKRHVVQYGHVREKIEVLKHHAHLLTVKVYVYLWVGYVRALNEYLAFRRLLQEVQRTQERALSAAGGPNDDHDFAAAYLGAYTVQSLDFAVVIVLFNVLSPNYT